MLRQRRTRRSANVRCAHYPSRTRSDRLAAVGRFVPDPTKSPRQFQVWKKSWEFAASMKPILAPGKRRSVHSRLESNQGSNNCVCRWPSDTLEVMLIGGQIQSSQPSCTGRIATTMQAGSRDRAIAPARAEAFQRKERSKLHEASWLSSILKCFRHLDVAADAVLRGHSNRRSTKARSETARLPTRRLQTPQDRPRPNVQSGTEPATAPHTVIRSRLNHWCGILTNLRETIASRIELTALALQFPRPRQPPHSDRRLARKP